MILFHVYVATGKTNVTIKVKNINSDVYQSLKMPPVKLSSMKKNFPVVLPSPCFKKLDLRFFNFWFLEPTERFMGWRTIAACIAICLHSCFPSMVLFVEISDIIRVLGFFSRHMSSQVAGGNI